MTDETDIARVYFRFEHEDGGGVVYDAYRDFLFCKFRKIALMCVIYKMKTVLRKANIAGYKNSN